MAAILADRLTVVGLMVGLVLFLLGVERTVGERRGGLCATVGGPTDASLLVDIIRALRLTGRFEGRPTRRFLVSRPISLPAALLVIAAVCVTIHVLVFVYSFSRPIENTSMYLIMWSFSIFISRALFVTCTNMLDILVKTVWGSIIIN